jgi:hypothetical protein
MAGTWTAQILWANGRGHVQSPPDTPGPYTGTVTFQASGQNFTTSPASAPVTIPPRSSVSVPLSIAMPQAPGDAPESVQFTTPFGQETSVPNLHGRLARAASTGNNGTARASPQARAVAVSVPTHFPGRWPA